MTNFTACANFFQRASIKEREYLSALAMALEIDAFYPQPNKSPFDCIFIKGERTFAVESKVRNYFADDFETTLIEKGKYDSLKKIIETNYATCVIYVEFFEKDKMALMYNLGKIPEPTWEDGKFVKNTVVDNGSITKKVGYIHKSLSKPIHIQKQINILWNR